MEKSRSLPHEHSSSYYTCGLGYEGLRSNSYSFNGPSGKDGEGFSASGDPEEKRRRRVASYNVFTVQGRLKSSVRSSFKWIKTKISDIRYGGL